MKKLIVICATCGVGKSTVLDFLRENNSINDYIFLDTDNVGLNWHEYKDLPDGGNKYSKDCLDMAVKLSGNRNIVWATCMNPLTYAEIRPIREITETYFINLICSNEELYKRLKGRPAERMTHSDEFIETQVEYMDWFKKNTELMNLVINSSNQSVNETAKEVEKYIKRIE